MEIRLPGTGTCDWCGERTSMPARLCLVADPDLQECLCDPCAHRVEQLRGRVMVDRLVAELEDPLPPDDGAD